MVTEAQRDLLYQAALNHTGDPELAKGILPDLVAHLEGYHARSGKKCDICHERKPLASFSFDASRPDALRRICKTCDTKVRTERRRREGLSLVGDE